MTDFHEIVVDHIREVVGRKAVIFQDHLVVNFFVAKDDFTVNDVFESCLALRYLHPDDEGLPFRFFFFDLLLRESMQAVSVVLGLGVLLTAYLDSHLLETLSCAETGVRVSIFEECVDELVVDRESLTLIVRPIRSHCFLSLTLLARFKNRSGPFFPVKPCPFQHPNYVFS